MKINFNKSLLLATALLTGGNLMAQTSTSGSMGMTSAQMDSLNRAEYVQPFSPSSAYRTWSVGLEGGLLTPYTIFRSSYEDYAHPASKVGYGLYVKNQLTHSFGLQLTGFRGQVAGSGAAPGAINNSIRQSYNTQIEYAVDLQGVFTLANISYHNHRNYIQPYASAGFGLSGFKPRLYSGLDQTGTLTNYHADNSSTKSAYIPVGIGMKFNLSPVVSLDLGYQVNFVDADNFDGYSLPNKNDKFSYAHAGLEFSLGHHAKPQMATQNPVNSIRIEYLTEEQRLQKQLDDERAAIQGLRSDLATTNANLASLAANVARLTADTDGDGVLDILDKCPNTPPGTKVDGSGCPLPVATNTVVVITDEDRKIVGDAIKNLEFEFAKATIKEHSFPSLDRVADLLKTKGLKLKLAGYTDAIGSVKANLQLSKNRAQAVKNYLVSKGVDSDKIQSNGYGKAHPIASNKTDAGRQKNRRVEFTLYN